VRLGILGGTFDPPHVGHLLAASDAHQELGLDRLILIPAAVQPLKGGSTQTAASDRLAMTRLLVGDDPRFSVDSIEIDREGLSFTVDTLETYAARFSGAERFLLIGADSLQTFPQWKEPDRILQLARLAVLTRTDSDGAAALGNVGATPPEILKELTTRAASAGSFVPVILKSRRIDVSSTEIRARVAKGMSIRGFVTEAVADFITKRELYQ
jgi:nicotinate-nucleotide adenylyltransferase